MHECPSCQSLASTERGRARGFISRLAGRPFIQPFYEIRECSECGLLYRSQSLDTKQLRQYYSLVDYHKWETRGFYPTERAVHGELSHLCAGSRILDFGCSSGRLLAPLTRSHQCYGYEVNSEAAAVAASKGLKILTGDLESARPAFYDALVLMDVFEHLERPTQVLRKLVSLLKPGGRLLVVSGNSDYPACQLDPAQFWYFRIIEHLGMLNRKYADYLQKELNLRMLKWQELSHYDTPLRERAIQFARHWSYWQFRNRTLMSRILLRFVPVLRRARKWPLAPAYTMGADHVLLVFEKR